MKKFIIIGFAILFASTITSEAQAILFFDGTFTPSDWTLYTETLVSGGTTTPSQVLAGGTPGAYRRIDNVVSGGGAGSGIWGFNINNNAIYDPSAGGAISEIDYEEDARAFQNAFGQGQATGPALRQNGKNYFAGGNITPPSQPWHNGKSFFTGGLITGPSQEWHSLSLSDLNNADFGLLSDANDHPDFSASANSILFGFYRANSTLGTSGYALDGAIDNWKIEASVVPEPATILLFSSGLAGMLLRRRKKV